MRRCFLVQLEGPRSPRSPSRYPERGWSAVHAARRLGGSLPASGWLSVLREGGPGVPADSCRALASWLNALGSCAGTASCPACSCVPLPAVGSCPAILPHNGADPQRKAWERSFHLGCVCVWDILKSVRSWCLCPTCASVLCPCALVLSIT